MLKRITTGWTFIRALYLFMGITLMEQALTQNQWFGLAFGGYFASMALFSFGCASGNCFLPNSKQNKTAKITADISDEEVK